VLFITGTEDVAVPINDVLEQSKLPAISYIHVLDGVGHMGMVETPGKITQYLDEFVNQLVEANV
jgi:pimeloyl-ACP methyl ester carboxylesterase